MHAAHAVASLVMYFVDDARGIDITVNHIFQCAGALVVFNIPRIISKKFRCYIPNFITITLYVFAFAPLRARRNFPRL